jgi:hypothetical protein
MTTSQVAQKLVALCKAYRNNEAMHQLYADDIVVISDAYQVIPFAG